MRSAASLGSNSGQDNGYAPSQPLGLIFWVHVLIIMVGSAAKVSNKMRCHLLGLSMLGMPLGFLIQCFKAIGKPWYKRQRGRVSLLSPDLAKDAAKFETFENLL